MRITRKTAAQRRREAAEKGQLLALPTACLPVGRAGGRQGLLC
ncbi:MAG: hypothetical protein ABIK26_01950 [Candidatus Omnitrophota bacterium]